MGAARGLPDPSCDLSGLLDNPSLYDWSLVMKPLLHIGDKIKVMDLIGSISVYSGRYGTVIDYCPEVYRKGRVYLIEFEDNNLPKTAKMSETWFEPIDSLSQFKEELSAAFGLDNREAEDLILSRLRTLKHLVETLQKEVDSSKLPEVVKRTDTVLGDRSILQVIEESGPACVFSYLNELLSYHEPYPPKTVLDSRLGRSE